MNRFFYLIKLMFRNLKRFTQSESGMTLPLLALSMVAMTGIAGIAIDVGRLQLVQSKLQFSLDAAALAAGSTISTADLNTEVNKYFNVNFNGYLGATVTSVSATANSQSTQFNLAATATIPATFMNIFGIRTLTANATSQITRILPSLEVAIVIDVSYGDDVADFKAGLTNFINRLFSEAAGTTGNLWVSIVPFSHVVNIGTQNTAWLNSSYSSALMTQYPAGWGPGGSWGGCVDERQNGEDVTDDPPGSGANTLFNEYYWYSDTLNPGSTLNPSGGINAPNSVPSIANKMGISSAQASSNYFNYSQWTTYNGGVTNPLTNQNFGYSYGVNIWNDSMKSVHAPSSPYFASPLNPLNQGPNFMCPNAITPLTNNQATLLNAISSLNIQGDWIPNIGLAWGWRALSPRWQGLWGGVANSNNLPLPYNTPGNNKVIVWVEGIEVMNFSWNPLVLPTSLDDYIRSGYGYLSDNVLGTTDWNTANNVILYNKTLQVCQAMKDQGIFIYVVGYSANGTYNGGGSFDANLGAMSICPTAQNYGFFYGAGNWTGWDGGLDQIADALVKLRVSK